MKDAHDAPATLSHSPEREGFDLFLSYSNLDLSLVETVNRRLLAKGVRTFFDRTCLPYDMLWFDALEESLNLSRTVAVFIGKERLGVWQKREMILALNRQAERERAGERFPVIPVLLPGAEIENAPAFLRLNNWIDLRGMRDDPSAIDALWRAVSGSTSSRAAASSALCPYRALRVFREEDAPLFFGRETVAEVLLNKLRGGRRLLVVVGPSGSGKSSVVQAGLLPLLRRERPPSATWDAVTFTPGKRPFHNLAATLVALWETAPGEVEYLREAEALGTNLAAGRIDLKAAVELTLKKSPGTERLLVIVDQAEELFTLVGEADRRSFVKSLLEVSTLAPATVVLTLRADFYGQAIGLSRELSDLIQVGIVNLGPMTRDELRRAVEHPARKVGLDFEPGLVNRILDHVEGQPGNLPLLEFALTELWERREGDLLTNRQYEQIGTVEGAIGQRAEHQLELLTPAQKELALSVLTRLVRVSAANEEGTDTRQRVKLDELEQKSLVVVRAFVDARLLVTSWDEASGGVTVEVAHEALIRKWERLQKLLNSDRTFLLWRQRLGLRVGEWLRAGRDKGSLLQSGPALQEAVRYAKERDRNLNDLERRFIEESRSAAKVQRHWAKVAAAVLGAFLLGAGAWQVWIRSDRYQLTYILRQSREQRLFSSSEHLTVHKWIRTLALTGRLEEAFAAARELPEGGDIPTLFGSRTGILVSTADTLFRAGRRDDADKVAGEAVVAARASSHKSVKVELLLAVARMKIKLAKPDGAKSVLGEAREAARAAESAEARVKQLILVANALLKGGWAEDAQATVLEAAALRRQIQLAALGEASTIYTDDPHTETLSECAETLFKAGRTDEAREIASEAFNVARHTRNADVKPGALFTVANALLAVGLPQEAQAATREAVGAAGLIKDPDDRETVITNSVETFINLRKMDAALAIAHRMREPEQRIKTLAKISQAMLADGNAEGGKKLADEATNLLMETTSTKVLDSLDDFSGTPLMLAEVGRAGGTESAAEWIISSANKYADARVRYAYLRVNMNALLAAGRLGEVERVASVTLDALLRLPEDDAGFSNINNYSEFYDVFMKLRREDEARRVAGAALGLVHRLATSSPSRASYLGVVAGMYVRLHENDEAARLAQESHSLLGHSKTNADLFVLTSVASVLAKAGQRNAAKALLDEALAASNEFPRDDERCAGFANVAKVEAQLQTLYAARQTADLCNLSDRKLQAYTSILLEYSRVREPGLTRMLEDAELGSRERDEGDYWKDYGSD
jgi:tetratricopeptide (TPR) repeat protein